MHSKAYKFRIYPTDEQKIIMDDAMRCASFIYNHLLRLEVDTDYILENNGLREKEKRYEWRTRYKLWFNKYEASRYLTMMSKNEKYSFLRNSPATLRSYVIGNLDNAFKNIKKTGAGFPNFKNKRQSNSYTVQVQKKSKLVIKGKMVYLSLPGTPKNPLTNVEVICHRDEFIRDYDKLKINSATISKNQLDQYFVSFQVDINEDLPPLSPIMKERSVGIDFGVIRPVTTSNNIDFDNDLYSTRIKHNKQTENEIKRLQRIVSKKRHFNGNWKNSKKYKRILDKLRKLQIKQTNQAENIRHNISSSIIKNPSYDTVIIEDLKLKNMSKKSGKGKSNRKSDFNRVLINTGIGSITEQLQYKSKLRGKNIIKVDPKYTSLTCSECGNVDKLNRINQHTFKCTVCGCTMNADLNAAKNIKEKYFAKNLDLSK